jgi:asparagine synthetase B (glutamine-hydrolysing)
VVNESYKIDGDKMVLSGEGADELFEVFVFHKAPNAQERRKMYVS